MNLYRMQVKATLCFDVQAPDENTAVAEAIRYVDATMHADLGHDVDTGDGSGCRVYANDNAVPRVLDVMDEEKDPNDCAACARSHGPHYTGPCEH